MEAVPQVIGQVTKLLMEFITRQVGYVTSSTTQVTNLRDKMDHLKDKRTAVQQHMEQNIINNREIPRSLDGWLKDVETIEKDVNSISSNGRMGCFNIKKRYQATKKAMKATEKIENLIKRNSEITWSDARKPPARVDSKPVSASAPSSSSSSGGNGDTHTGFKSRDVTFNHALNLLQDNDKTRVIALCGMGGLGKTTMMEQLKEFAANKKMFDYIVTVVVGRDPNLYSIQNAIAENTGEHLIEINEGVRADLLCKRFKNISEEGKKKILIILDDVWEKVNLKGIGLTNPLPNGFKLLLTSRDANVCKQIAIDAVSAHTLYSVYSLISLNLLEEAEAHSLFSQITDVSKDNDAGKYKIGCDIIKKCGGLPLAIKLIATTLKSQERFAWIDASDRLKNNDLDKNLKEIIEISYNYLGEEERVIFLLCGLFPEDFNIQIEDLTRYAWGLRLLGVSTLREARNRTRTHVSYLKNVNLLIDGHNDYSGCVKMHDLVHAFVVGFVSNGKEAWIIEHGDMSSWNKVKMNESCKRISLSCNGRSEFPSNFKFPNVSVLKLMQGDKSLTFPRNFYEEMGSLEVIAYDEMNYPSVSASSHCFTNLRTLCFHKCSLMFDCSSIGNLLNLEVLSFANSGIQKVPSTIGNLKKLKLLDITGSVNLVIDDGVLKNLEELEELCMRLGPKKKGFRFKVDIWKEVAEISNKLTALEIELFENNGDPKNISFENLETFKISVGRYLEEENEKMRSHENTLMIVTNRVKLLESKMNELFGKTEVLHLKVDGMIDLEDVYPEHSSFCFCNLRVLVISDCKELRCLFKFKVATSLSNLEHLEIKNCPVMEELVHIESNGAQKITFPKLKSLIVCGLPKFTSIFPINKLAACSMLSDNCAVQPFFSEKVVIPKLEELHIVDMKILKEIWPCDFSSREEVNVSMLRKITVTGCDCLENLFPINPMSMLHQLEVIEVNECGSIEVLFNIDLDCVGEIEEGSTSRSRLRRIEVSCSRKLKEIWRVKGVNNSASIIISGFEALERIAINFCDRLENLFPSNPMSWLHQLEEIEVVRCGSIEVLFNIDLDCVREIEECSRSRLRIIDVYESRNLKEIWRVKGVNNSASIIISGFEALERIEIRLCERFRNVFTPITSNFDLRSLTTLGIHREDPLEMNIKSKDQEISRVGDNISNNVVFPSYLLHNFHHLRQLYLINFEEDKEVVFEIDQYCRQVVATAKTTNKQPLLLLPYLELIELHNMKRMSHVWKCSSNWKEFLILQQQQPQPSSFHNLTTIFLIRCKSIKYLFSPLMAQLLSNLKIVDIESCDGIEEVVSSRDDEEDEEGELVTFTSAHKTTSLFPHLHLLRLSGLPNLKHIGGGGGSDTQEGRNDASSSNNTATTTSVDHQVKKLSQAHVVSWSLCQYSRTISIFNCGEMSSAIPSYAVGHMKKLEELSISNCKSMTDVFETQGINNNTTNVVDEGTSSTPLSTPRLNVPHLSNLKDVDIKGCYMLQHVFTFSTLESLGQLEVLKIGSCNALAVIMKEEDGGQTTNDVVFPRLKSMELVDLPNLVGFFMGVNDFQWPSLEKVVIDECPQIKKFTGGRSSTPKLNFMHTRLGKHSLEFGLNFHVNDRTSQQTSFSSFDNLQWIPWSFHNLVEMDAMRMKDKTIIPSNELVRLQKLEKIHLSDRYFITEVFEALNETNSGSSESQTVVKLPNLREVDLYKVSDLEYIWKSNQWTIFEFPNLTKVFITSCEKLKHVFTCSMVGSLLKLQDLNISDCEKLEVIVKEEGEEEYDAKVKEVVELPCLKSVHLNKLSSLKGFCLGNEAFSLPSLDTIEIMDCPALTIFTKGSSITPKLKIMDTSFGRCNINEDLNSFVNEKKQQEREF